MIKNYTYLFFLYLKTVNLNKECTNCCNLCAMDTFDLHNKIKIFRILRRDLILVLENIEIILDNKTSLFL